ncbi:hypothetical protein C1H46_026107 [Malus baccata]|uniref:Uncharacterized protein n=1 Tax=Malus baccata TaxID=106549 RepID=A0A540LPG0_MALBA|nr:hypothetical protein C1H46_026107 [Malus baccata]
MLSEVEGLDDVAEVGGCMYGKALKSTGVPDCRCWACRYCLSAWMVFVRLRAAGAGAGVGDITTGT